MHILENRVLFKDGKSLATDEFILNMIAKTGDIPEYLLAMESFDSRQFDYKYSRHITPDDNDAMVEPEYYNSTVFSDLIEFLYDNKRDNTSDIEHGDRLDSELKFFCDNQKEGFLCNIKDFIDTLYRDGVVWGGRGSSCASYALFLIGVHPVNPIKYEINFKEFSKEV